MKEISGHTRRNFLTGAMMLSLSQSSLARAATLASATTERLQFAYVGTYTGAPGAGSNGEGIYLFEMNPRTGQLANRRLVAKADSPSWIAIYPSKKFLYAVNEVSNFAGSNGSITAYAIDEATGALRLLNCASSQGAGPAYVGLDATGRFIFVANYGDGSLAVLSLLPDGSLGPVVDVRHDIGSVGNIHATDIPAGSFAVSGHDGPHVHMFAADPANRFALAVDLGQDRIYSFHFDPATGKLSANQTTPYMSLPSGDGPRHFAFHPNGRWLYSVQEESSTVVCFHYDLGTGSMTAVQTLSTLPTGFTGTSFASEILLSPDGRYLYAANRLHDSIAIFAIGSEGRLVYVTETLTRGDYPAQCRIDPTGRFLYACNRRSDCITAFRIDRASGLLTFTGEYAAVGSPASITFLS